MLLGHTASSQRAEIHISGNCLIQNQYKLLTGSTDDIGVLPLKLLTHGHMLLDTHAVGWGLQAFKNSITIGRDCSKGCLFNILDDPNEDKQIKDKPEVLASMMERLTELNKGIFKPDRGKPSAKACKIAEEKYRGYYGPFVGIDEIGKSIPLVLK